MATLKETTIAGNLTLPVGTSGNRQAAANGAIRFNSTLRIVEKYDTTTGYWLPVGYDSPLASGGDVTDDITIGNATYRVHKFTSVGLSTIQFTRAGEIEYLVVGGGGPGGCSQSSQGGGGGGGAGGVLIGKIKVPVGTHNVTVGRGGVKPTANTTQIGSNGQPSSFMSVTALGGGAGGNGAGGSKFGLEGASGGGGGYNGYSTQASGAQGAFGQGFRGSGVVSGSASGGGGGGAAGYGNPNSDDGGPGNGGTGGLGGPGIRLNFDGNDVVYGQGGQAGSANSDGVPPANTGQGGRGAYAASGAHYDGATGVVMIRYRIG